MNTKKAFTLIELLITIAIIGILAGTILTVIGSARTKARDASFVSSAKSVSAAVGVCCKGDGVIQEKILNEGSNVNVCDDTSIIDGVFPGDENIGTVTLDVDCADGAYQITVTPGTSNTGDCQSITYDDTGETVRVGC